MEGSSKELGRRGSASLATRNKGLRLLPVLLVGDSFWRKIEEAKERVTELPLPSERTGPPSFPCSCGHRQDGKHSHLTPVQDMPK